jgi:serine/threonine protein kinase
MNGNGQPSGNDDADRSAPVREPPSPTQAGVPSPIIQPTVPDYELIRRIGRGAYGEVWLARNQATGALRAAKIVWRHTFEDARPFQREFAGIQRFERISREHPSQLALFHIGRNEPGGYFYYVMELADGLNAECEVRNAESEEAGAQTTPHSAFATLHSYAPHTLRADLERGRLPASRVLEIGLALSEALSHLHANGLVHRDVKPSNVIFVNGRPKLADIGLVTDASDQCSIVGTEGYLPPEGPGTPQADIFALGKVLYEAATGRDRREFPDLPPDIRSWPDAAEVFELNEIILKACAQDAKARYQTCDEMHADLTLLGQGKSVKQKRTQQQRWAVAKKVFVMAGVVGVLAASAVFLSREIAPTDAYPDGPPSTNVVANMLCDKGLVILRGDNYAQSAEAYTNFQLAIELDTNFARPYVGLVELSLREPTPIDLPTNTTDMRVLAGRLKQLAPHLGATAIAQSIVNYYDWDFPAARRFAMQAIKANPKYELGHTWYGFMLTYWGWPVEGRAQLEISRNISPSKAIVYRCIGHTYYTQRDFTNAITWYRDAIELDRHHSPDFLYFGRSLEAMGDWSNAFDAFETTDILVGQNEDEVRRHWQNLRETYKTGGMKACWQQEWEETEAKPNEAFYWKAILQIRMGNKDSAFKWLQKSFDAHEPDGLDNLLVDPDWDSVHDDPRFKSLLDKISFTKVMPPSKK